MLPCLSLLLNIFMSSFENMSTNKSNTKSKLILSKQFFKTNMVDAYKIFFFHLCTLFIKYMGVIICFSSYTWLLEYIDIQNELPEWYDTPTIWWWE